MTATMLPPSTAADRLTVVEHQITQCDEAIQSGAYGWAEKVQDEKRRLLAEYADLLGELGRDRERQTLLRELALGA